MRRIFIVVLFTVLTTHLAAAFGNEVEVALNQQYQKRNYSLRHPVIDNTQRFDSSGKLLGSGREGSWTIYSRLYIRKIKLRPDKLTVEADRVGYAFDTRSNRLVPTKLDDSVKLEIALDQPLASSEQANAILGRIFAFSVGDFVASVPTWWRPFLESHTEVLTGDESLRVKEQAEERRNPAPASDIKVLISPIQDADGIYQVGGGVTTPYGVFTPDPDYTDVARSARFTGISVFQFVVEETGKVSGDAGGKAGKSENDDGSSFRTQLISAQHSELSHETVWAMRKVNWR